MTAPLVSRRRALTILAGTAGALALGSVPSAARHEWRGTALGADARIVIAGYGADDARRIIKLALAEVGRQEEIFSLYRPDSELARLNRDGRLASPSHDLRLLLDRAIGYWQRTDGAFNPAIQPLWRFLAAHFATTPGRDPEAAEISRLREFCDPARIERGPGALRLAPGMALTFNGIAQGHITDRVVDLLASEGAQDILLALGELRALPGRAWTIDLPDAGRTITISGRAVATSAGAGTPFTNDSRWHHLIDPRTGRSGTRLRSVTVIADGATEADALSTAIAVSSAPDPAQIATRFAGATAIAVARDGRQSQAPLSAQAPAHS